MKDKSVEELNNKELVESALQTEFNLDEALRIKGELDHRFAALEAHADLMVDEFKRIMALDCSSEIKGICKRAIEETVQKVPVIQQRDALEAEVKLKTQEVLILNQQMDMYIKEIKRLTEAEELSTRCITQQYERLKEMADEAINMRSTIKRMTDEMDAARSFLTKLYDLLLWPTDDKEPPLRHIGEREQLRRMKDVIMKWVGENQQSDSMTKEERGK